MTLHSFRYPTSKVKFVLYFPTSLPFIHLVIPYSESTLSYTSLPRYHLFIRLSYVRSQLFLLLPSLIAMKQIQWLIAAFIQEAVALPNVITTRDTKFEWTALGDSYASGVGSTNYIDGRRCLRYDEAWPVLLNQDKDLAAGDHIFNNVVCSGAHYSDVEAYQFYDEDQTGQPNWQFSPRPKFGDPQMATLAVGGDDIDFPGIVFSKSTFGVPLIHVECCVAHTWKEAL